MPKALEQKLKKEYPDNPHAVYGTMNKIEMAKKMSHSDWKKKYSSTDSFKKANSQLAEKQVKERFGSKK